MSRVLSYAVLALLAALAVVYFAYGRNVFLGGPSKGDIIAVALQAAVDSAPDEAAKKLAAEAAISPRGICNSASAEGYACIVDVTVAGYPTTSMVAILKQGPNGEWILGN